MYQGSNRPLELDFDEPIASVAALSVVLSDHSGRLILKRTADELTIEDNKILIPLTQEETAQMPSGKAKILVKWKTLDGYVDFAEEAFIEIVNRADRMVIL